MVTRLSILGALCAVVSVAVAKNSVPATLDGVPTIDKCTAIAVGKQATIDGSTMTTHTADCAECDWRISKVPARDWPKGTMRPVYLYRSGYPQKVSELRGHTWSIANLEKLPQRDIWTNDTGVILGYIPEVPHTYALIEGMYGIMNEHQVAMGESTCAAKLWAAPKGFGGNAIFELNELSLVALERSKTAREAILTMGSLATQYGYYSCDWTSGGDVALGEGGEALTVIDKTEAWVFHILPDDTGSSAVWVAQRVPDGHITAVANQFVIRKVDPKSKDFLFSDNLWLVAERNGWWSPDDGLLDFLPTYAPPRAHSAYSTRRVWRVFGMAAPSIKLSPRTDTFASDYPFSVKPDTLLSAADLMRFQRDHYEGTEFDLTKGVAAGPYGEPNRFDVSGNGNMTLLDALQGGFERAISLFRTSYSFVATSRSDVPDVLSFLWFTQYAPAQSQYIPIYVATEELPPSWIRGSFFKFEYKKSAWWAFASVGNWASKFYKYAMKDVWAVQQTVEEHLFKKKLELETRLLKLIKKTSEDEARDEIVDTVTDFVVHYGEYVHEKWVELFETIATRYHDGYEFSGFDKQTIEVKRLFYPIEWLQAVGYFNSPPNPDGIMFASNTENYVSYGQYVAAVTATAFICSTVFLGVGFAFARRRYNRKGYNVIAL